jgi:hypothetical protein
VKEGEVFHIALLSKTPEGKLVTPGGRWIARLARTHAEVDELLPEEWPVGMLDEAPGRLGDLVVPIIDPAAQLYAKESAALIPGHPLTEKHRDDIERLRAALDARQRRP